MIPSVQQQLTSARRTLAETVLPAIDPTDHFAMEQAGLIVATLDRVLDVQASEYRYDLQEWEDAHALVAALAGLEARGGSTGPAAGPSAAGSDPAAGDGAPATGAPADLDELRAATLAAQEQAEARFRALAETDAGDAARALLAVAARRAADRELAAARMTGFPRSVGSIAEVLDRQAAEPFGAAALPEPAEATR